MKKYIWLALLYPLFLSACNANKPLSQAGKIAYIQEEPAILFLFCSIESENGKSKISINEQREKKGVLKSTTKQGRPNKNTLTAVLFNREHKLFDIPLQHPLRPSFEIMEKDAHENVSKKLERAEFSLRFQKDKQITHIQFIENIDGKSDTLNTITLTQ